MGYENFRKKSNAQLAKHIRTIAKDTSKVFLTQHAKTRMLQRKLGMQEVYECLQLGSINIEPEEDASKGSLSCRMERYVSGRQLGIVVAICDEDPDLVVVTIFKVD